MNKLIKSFLVRSGGHTEVDDVTQDEWTYTENLDVEKFAQMIIGECMTICEKMGKSGDGHYCADAIQKKFGVL